MLSSRKKLSFTILFFWDFPKSWSQKWKVGVTYSKSGVNENSETEFSETPNPAYFYAYFCCCTRKISFRRFSFTLYCHWTSKLNFKDVQRTSEISFVRRNRYPRCPKIVKKARPLLTSCIMFALPTYWKFATCVDWALRTSHFPLAGVLLTSVSSGAVPFCWLHDHCVYLSHVLSWLINSKIFGEIIWSHYYFEIFTS